MKNYGFPHGTDKKNGYFTIVQAYLIAEATRLQITPARMAALASLMGDETTPNTWVYVYLLWANKKGTRTGTVSNMLADIGEKLEDLLSEIYSNIPEELWNDLDRSTLNRAAGKIAPRTKPGNITDQCIAAIIHYGGGKMRVSCKSATDQSRASKAKNADGVQFFYDIVDQPSVNQSDTDTDAPIADPEKCSNRLYFSKAIFNLNLDAVNTGRLLVYYVRWYNSKYPGIAGPWLGPFNTLIS